MQMRWNPETGEAQVFAKDADVPEGWLDHHPADPAYAAPDEEAASQNKTPKPKPMTKGELTAALKSGGIEFDNDAKVAELDALLHGKLREVLTARGAQIADTATTRELWEAVSK